MVQILKFLVKQFPPSPKPNFFAPNNLNRKVNKPLC